MRNSAKMLGFVAPFLGALAALTVSPAAQADVSSCSSGKCSTSPQLLTLNGMEPLRTDIDTGWMPSCDNGVEHCNKGVQVRANIAMSAVLDRDPLFVAQLAQSAGINASWENRRYLELSAQSGAGQDCTLSIKHSLRPQVELYVDVGPVEKGFVWGANDLVNKLPGAKFQYEASAQGKFAGWAFDGTELTVPAPALQTSQLLSVSLNALDQIVEGEVGLHARTSPTFKFKTTKVVVAGHELSAAAVTQIPFPEGDFDYLDFPATIETELSAKGEIEVMPSATVSRIGDMNFSPPTTITFSSVSVKKAFDAAPQKYTFADQVVRIGLPNVRAPREQLDGGQVSLGSEGVVPAIVNNTGLAAAQIRLESEDSHFIVPSTPITIGASSPAPLNITFRPDAEGRVQGKIKAYTNDPDLPEFTFTVSGEGVDGPVGTAKPNSGTDEDDGMFPEGCGCKTAGGNASSGYAGLGALVLGLAAFARRRRSN